MRYDRAMPDDSGALKPAGGGGRAFLGVRRMQPQDDGIHLYDDAGAEIGVVRYGETVYINGRVVSFTAPKPGE
jgi:hypothetical protein